MFPDMIKRFLIFEYFFFLLNIFLFFVMLVIDTI